MGLRLRSGLAAMSAAVALACACRKAFCDTYINYGGSWGTPINWSGNIVPPGTATDVVELLGFGNTNVVTSDHDPWVLNGLSFYEFANAVSASNQHGIEFDGTNPFIFAEDFQGQTTINAPLILAKQVDITQVREGGAVTVVMSLTNSISGPGGFTVESGTVALNGSNTFSGGIVVNGSGGATMLKGNNSQSFGSGAITLAGISAPAKLSYVLSTDSLPNDIAVQGTLNQFLLTRSGTLSSLGFGSLIFNPGGSSVAFMEDIGGVDVRSASFASIQLLGNGTLQNAMGLLGGNPAMTIRTGGIFESGGSFSFNLNGSSTTMTISGSSSYSGGTFVGSYSGIIGNAPASFGTGAISLASSSTLTLNAPSCANAAVTGQSLESTVNYNANGAAGGNLITAGTILLGNSVTSPGADSFTVFAGGLLAGGSQGLASLDRLTNIHLGQGVTVLNNSGGLPVVSNLGTAADLFLGFTGSYTGNISIGAGTPWLGLNGSPLYDPTGFTPAPFSGTLSLASAVTLENVRLGNGSSGSVALLAGTAAGSQVVSMRSTTLYCPTPDFSGVDHIEFTGSSRLDINNALGGGGNAPIPPAEVVSGSTLILTSSGAINGTLHMAAGSSLMIATAGLNGSGTITLDDGPVTFLIRDKAALAGAQFPRTAIRAQDIVVLSVNDIAQVSLINPAATFAVGHVTEAEGFNVNGGTFRMGDGLGAELDPSNAPGAVNAIHVGPAGESFTGGGLINVPIISPVPISVGTLGVSGGGITLGSTANSFPAISVYSSLYASGPATLAGAPITLYPGSAISFDRSQSSGTQTVPVIYPNTVTVPGGVVGINLPFSSLADGVATINAGDATLNFYSSNTGFQVGSLNLTGDVSLLSSGTLTLSSVAEDGTARALSIQSNNGTLVLPGLVNITGPISITNETVEVDGVVAASNAPFIVDGQGVTTLRGHATIHRPVTIGNVQFAPGTSITAGTLVVDSLFLTPDTILYWDLGAAGTVGGPANDLVVVNGALTLDGRMEIRQGQGFSAGIYTLFTYGGALTDNGFSVVYLGSNNYTGALDFSTPGQVNLVVTATPEPAALACMVSMLPLFMRRRKGRKPQRRRCQ